MKYALLVYDGRRSWRDLAREQRRALHGDYHAMAGSPGVIDHFRLRSPKKTTTLRLEDDAIVKTEGPLADTRETFRAIYLIESDDHDSVLDLAARIPAVRTGGAVEVWPLMEH